MTYELAKQLKDAGFPQSHPTEKEYMDQYRREDIIHLPTLSELIEACGDGFGILEKNMKEGGVWTATGWDEETFGAGEIPEEAVAKLWLTLHISTTPANNSK